jgi:hypothetical protein
MSGSVDDEALLKRMETSCISSCVLNVSKAMRSGAVLEIELSPMVALFSTLPPRAYASFHRVNPFHGVFDARDAMGAVNVLYHETKGEHIPPDILSSLSTELIDLMRSEMLYYHSSCGVCVSFAQLVDRVYWEMAVVHNLVTKQYRDVLIDSALATDSTEQFIAAYPNALYGTLPGAYGERICLQDQQTKGVDHGYKYTLSTFMPLTMFNLLLSSIAVQQNKPYIVRHLEKAGFRDVAVERRTNEHNSRQNVWMIRAVKA